MKNIAYSVFWRLLLGFHKGKFQVIPGLILTFMSWPEHIYSLWCPRKCWQGSDHFFFGSLHNAKPGILDIWPSVSVIYHVCHFPFLRQLGEKTHLAPRQDQSMVKICLFRRKRVAPEGKGEPTTCLECVCSHPSSSALCYSLRITFLFLPVILGSGRKPLMG